MSAVEVVTISVEELERRLEAAVRRALAPVDDWIGRDALAELLDVKPSSIKVLVRRDGLPAHTLGRGWRFKRSEVEAWLEQRATRPGGHATQHGATLLRVRAKRAPGG